MEKWHKVVFQPTMTVVRQTRPTGSSEWGAAEDLREGLPPITDLFELRRYVTDLRDQGVFEHKMGFFDHRAHLTMQHAISEEQALRWGFTSGQILAMVEYLVLTAPSHAQLKLVHANTSTPWLLEGVTHHVWHPDHNLWLRLYVEELQGYIDAATGFGPQDHPSSVPTLHWVDVGEVRMNLRDQVQMCIK